MDLSRLSFRLSRLATFARFVGAVGWRRLLSQELAMTKSLRSITACSPLIYTS